MNGSGIIERGPWQVEVKTGQDKIRTIIMSEDFTHDARLYLEGCATQVEAEQQARDIGTVLNRSETENVDQGSRQAPWRVHWHIENNTVYLARPETAASGQHILRITGDFRDYAQKMVYAREIAARLNRAAEDGQGR